MIKKIILILAIVLTAHFLTGQNVFRKGENAFTFGGGYRFLGTEAPSANIGYERSVWTKRDVGHFGIGLFADVLMYGDSISPIGSIRGAYHLANFKSKHVDVYAGAALSYSPIESESFSPDIFVGARFKINKKKAFGFFTEAAYYGTNIRAGICWIL